MKSIRYSIGISLFALLTSCTGRTYEAFEHINAGQVKNIIEKYAQRRYHSIKDAKYIEIDKNLGIFKENTVFVNVLKYEKNGVGFADAEVDIYLISDTLPKTYADSHTFIYSLADASYGLDVYVEGKGSYDIQDAYDNGDLVDDDIAVLTDNFTKKLVINW